MPRLTFRYPTAALASLALSTQWSPNAFAQERGPGERPLNPTTASASPSLSRGPGWIILPVISPVSDTAITDPEESIASLSPEPRAFAMPPLAASPAARATVPEGKWREAPLTPPPDDFYQTPQSVHPWVQTVGTLQPYRARVATIGKSVQGLPILAVTVNPRQGNPKSWRRLAVICRQHGNEPEATASGTRFLYQWLHSTDPAQQLAASKTSLFFVAICNPDGAARYARRTAQNVDMNRDWGKKKSPEVAALTRAIKNFDPHLVVDVHQWLPGNHVPPPMAEASGGPLARQAAQAMARTNAQRGFYLAARSRNGLDTLCHRYFGQKMGRPAILLESRHRPNVPGARDVAIVQTLTALWSAANVVSPR